MRYRTNRWAQPTQFTAPAKFPGRCAQCSKPFAAGDSIHARQKPGSSYWTRVHELCKVGLDAAIQSELDAKAERQRLADLRVQEIRNRLVWKNQTRIGGVEQQAWCDVYEILVPVNGKVSDYTDKELAEALAAYNQSSFGALRWETYRMSSVKHDDSFIRVVVTQHLCD